MKYTFSKLPGFFLLLTLITACTSSVEISELKAGLAEDNALRFNIEFLADDPINAKIAYWPLQDTTNIQTTGVSLKAKSHNFTLIGLLPQTAYAFQILVADDSGKEFFEATYGEFSTWSLPASLPNFNLEIDAGNVFDGFILVRHVVKPGNSILLDNQGRVVWYQLTDKTTLIPYSLTSDNTIISMDSPREINEIDLFGKLIFQSAGGKHDIEDDMHHEIQRLENKEILVLTHKFTKIDLSAIGGAVNDSIKADGIIKYDSLGNEIWSWDVLSVADPLKDKNILKNKQDWGHANAVSLTIDGNFIISFRDFDQVWKINGVTGELIWKLGQDGDFKISADDTFYQQHAVHELSQNELLIFDNGNAERPSTRALILKLDEAKRQILGSKSIVLPDSLYSYKQGSVYAIEGDKYLFCASAKRKVIITDATGKVMWQLGSTAPHYRAYYLTELPKQK